jgi:glycosyl hydrolase family 25
MRRLLPFLVVLALAGCGATITTTVTRTVAVTPTPVAGSILAPTKHYSLAAADAACPSATDNRGSLGRCAPKAQLGLTNRAAAAAPTTRYADASNNNPCDCGPAIKAAGNSGLIVKINQGTGYVDPTAKAMIASARAAGLAVGGYDFQQDYSVAEAVTFSNAAKADGLTPAGRSEFPLTLDVEFGAFSYSGLLAEIAYLHGQGWRVDIYTGGWYWSPHAGAVWPTGIPAWLSGYPDAPLFAGLPPILYFNHQYTDRGLIAAGHFGDLSVFTPTSESFAVFTNVAPKPKPAPKPTPIASTSKRLIAFWTTERLVTLAKYHRLGCKPGDNVDEGICNVLRTREHTLLLDIQRREITHA